MPATHRRPFDARFEKALAELRAEMARPKPEPRPSPFANPFETIAFLKAKMLRAAMSGLVDL